jgi:acetyltransferase EpsM
MRVAIFGAGGHAKVVWDILVATGHEVVGFAVDGEPPHGLLGLPVTNDLAALPPHDAVIVAIGDNQARKQKFEALQAAGHRFTNAIHPSAVLASRLTLGTGIQIAAGAIVNVDSTIGDNTILNTGATIDHDNQIGPHAHVAPGCHLAGNVQVGEGAFLGIGTTAIPGIDVGPWSKTGAGAVVIKNIPPHTLAIGVPAHPHKKNPLE